MTVEYQNSEKDYLDFTRMHQKKRLSKILFPLAVAALITGMSLTGDSPGPLRLALVSLLSFSVLCGVCYYVPVFRASRKLKQSILSQPSFLDRKKIRLQQDGLFFESVSKQLFLSWKEIIQVRSVDVYLYLLLSSQSFILVPAKAFVSETDFISFKASIQRGLVWGTTDPTQRWVEVRPKPPYLMGLLCLIPLIGAFFGLSFIISGISKYRDRWFTLIGIFGVLYTIAVYTSLYQFGKKQPFYKRQATELPLSKQDSGATDQDGSSRSY